MSHLNPGLISAYNSLTDKHLAGYFSNTRIRRHLQRAGLITRSGRIVPDKEYRHKLIQRAHHRHIRECLAQAIFHKVLEMERIHQIEIKRKLEEFARRERVHKIKVERSKRYEEDLIRILSPRPPTGARGIRKQHSGPEGEHSESSESPSSSRPNTAPGKMQRPVRLKPINGNNATASVRRSSPYRTLESSHENDQLFNCPMDKEFRRRLTTTEASNGISPYCLPVINNFVTPVPPATRRKERGAKVTASSTVRGRRLRPTTASSGADDPPLLRSSVHQSRVCVNVVYFGKAVHLSHDLTDMRDEVKVFQQHCGGENLCVYKGKLREGETFQFISRRHRGFPFSLTFFLNGLQVERLSSCCEFKHRKGSRLGGRHGHFGFSSVEAASPCYKCIIAMGLDKKPTPPPKRLKEYGIREESVSSPKDSPEMETQRTREDAVFHSECETSQPQDMETQVEEEAAPEGDKVRDDYEEDFEADDEGPAEDTEAKQKKSPSPSSETEKQVKEEDASETEDEEKDEDMKSRSGSSSSDSDQEETDAVATKDSKEEEKAEQPKEADQEETDAVATKESKEEEKAEQPKEADQEETDDPPDENPNPEEAAATTTVATVAAAETEGESAVAKDSGLLDSAEDSTEIEISDTSVPSGNENRRSDDISGDKDAGKAAKESKQEEEQERAKSVQEKLAEAILKESQCSSEPELSDTSTEEEEEATDKDPKQDNEDAVAETLVTVTEQQQTLEEETQCEESVTGEGEVAPEQEETSETKERRDDEQQPHENGDEIKEEKVSEVEEDEKAAEDTAEKNKLEDPGGTQPAVNEENVAQDDKTADTLEEAKCAGAEAAEKDEEKEEKTAAEADIQLDETGQGAKSSEGDESSVSEPNKKTDETAVPDNAEAEAMTASETMEIKAESSEEREALSCEEAPVTDTEKRQHADSEDGEAASETEVTAENSSSLTEGSGDTTVKKTADTSEENTKDESSKDDIKEDAEQTSGTEARKGDSQQEKCEVEKSEETDEKVEEQKSEEDAEEEEKQSHKSPDERAEDENSEEGEKDQTEEGSDESKAMENFAEVTENYTNTEGQENDKEAQKTVSEEDKSANDEKVEDPAKTETDEDSECVGSKNDKEESEAQGADKHNEGEGRNEADTAAEEKDDEAEKSEKDDNERKAEQSEVMEYKNEEECEEKKDAGDKTAGEGGETSDNTEKLEKSADADLAKEDVKISDEDTVETKDGDESEAADGTKTPEETLNTTTEAGSVQEESKRGSSTSEKAEVNGENGETSTGAESKPREDEGEAHDKNDSRTAEQVEEERKTEEPNEDDSADVKESTVESGDGAEKHEDDKVDQAPDADQVESEGKEGDDSVEKHEESTKNSSEPETSGTEIKEDPKLDDRKDGEETGQDANDNKSDLVNEKSESDLMEKNNNIQNSISEETAASSADLEKPSAIDDTAQLLDKGEKEPAARTDKHLHPDENAAGVDLSAADGENGADTEEASKASEEGASVLLKPQAQNNDAESSEQSVQRDKESPEALAREDNTDLVSNWVNTHQSSKFFETFIEPLEDLRAISDSSKDETQSTELPRSESPLKRARTAEDEENALSQQDENESEDKTKLKAVESDLSSNHAEDESCENEPAKDTVRVEETEVKGFIPKTETDQSDQDGQDTRSGEHRGSSACLEEDEAQDGPTQGVNEDNVFSKTEVESIAGFHHSVASSKPESVSGNRRDEKTTDNGPDFYVNQTTEMKDLPPSSKTDERLESKSPDGLKEADETWLKTDECSREATEITNFTTSKSDDGSRKESHHGDLQIKAPEDESRDRDRRDVQLIQDIKHTLSKDRLSTFSVDETLFGRSSYPLLGDNKVK
ncbi:glutamate-rich protein 3 isoform X2 [Embiotoca jacksoni]|uniref:glutamate-rich protein 3 isoform X2 n=1 Tax=Embiotoca jacksoni TaxID=100190 RepID=UPI0037046CFA